MAGTSTDPRFARDPSWLLPRWYLGALGGAFLACVVLGHLSAGVNPYGIALRRFSEPANYTAVHYPAARQVEAYLRQVISPDKITVVIGGDSRMFQPAVTESTVWSARLQEQLGDRFLVLNGSLPAGSATGFGLTLAEMALKLNPRTLFVTDYVQGQYSGDQLRFVPAVALREEAWADGLVTRPAGYKDPVEPASLAEWLQEVRIRARINRWLAFAELWNRFEYAIATTHLWSARLHQPFWSRSRMEAQSRADQASPAEHAAGKRELELPEGGLRTGMLEHLTWINNPSSDNVGPLVAYYGHNIPDALVDKTLIVFEPYAPKALTAAGIDAKSPPGRVAPISRFLKDLDLQTADASLGFEDADFYDWLHLNQAGGARLAAKLAPVIRAKADALGYEQQGRGGSPGTIHP